MKNRTWLAGLAIALGLGAAGASAQEWRAPQRQAAYASQARVDRLRAEIARDRMRVNENVRRGRHAAAPRNRAELARDQRELQALLRNTRNDARNDWRR
jgi:hypothetical protein